MDWVLNPEGPPTFQCLRTLSFEGAILFHSYAHEVVDGAALHRHLRKSCCEHGIPQSSTDKSSMVRHVRPKLDLRSVPVIHIQARNRPYAGFVENFIGRANIFQIWDKD